MAKQKKWVKIMAFLALFWITIWIIWTWVLVLFSWNNTNSSNTQTLSAEDYAKLQEMIESQSWITAESQVEIINNTLTWTIK
jgi:hypothetical protein